MLKDLGIIVTSNLDARLVNQLSKTVSIDSILKDIVTYTCSLDAILGGALLKTISIDAILSSIIPFIIFTDKSRSRSFLATSRSRSFSINRGGEQ